MKKLSAILGAAVLITSMSACSSTPEEPKGNPAVYERINSLEDCDLLQAEFDLASNNHDRMEAGEQKSTMLAYMKAANNRQDELGCFK